MAAYSLPESPVQNTQFGEPVQADELALPSRGIIFSFVLSEFMFSSRRPVSHEGRFAVVTDVEAGCGGRVDVAAWLVHADEQQSMRTVKSRGPDTPTLVSSWWLMHDAQH
jgi:hypothetical protein